MPTESVFRIHNIKVNINQDKENMPLTKETRHLLELAIINYLKTTGEATSKELYNHLKLRGFLAIRGAKQVSMICLAFERKGVLLSREMKCEGKLRPEVKKAWRLKIWRINPNFYKEHPKQSMFTIHCESLEEARNI